MPFTIMPSIKVAGPKGKAAVHDCDEVRGTYCEGCEHVECFENQGSRLPAGEHVIDNLIRRLEAEGWKEDL